MADSLCASRKATTNLALFSLSFLAMLTIPFLTSHSHWLACCFFVQQPGTWMAPCPLPVQWSP
jgi:hypothetical protein